MDIIKGKIKTPIRCLVYGIEGVGKSTFAASADNPVFICAEVGTNYLDVSRFPTPQNFADIKRYIQELTHEKHEFRTLVLDTLDWIEPLIWDQIIATATYNKRGEKATNIEEVGGGYGKGYEIALTEWAALLRGIDGLQAKTQMDVVMLSHCIIKNFANPEGENFDRYELKLNRKAAGRLKEWADEVLFASYEDCQVKGKGVSDGTRILRTERRSAFDAKNRTGLPYKLPLSWQAYAAARAGRPDAKSLIEEIRSKTADKRILKALENAGEDIPKLLKMKEYIDDTGKTQS